MRMNPDKINRVVSAEALSLLTTDVQQPAETGRDKTGSRLAHEPLISTRVISAVVRVIEGVLVAAAGVGLALLYPGFGPLAEPSLYVPTIVAAAVALPALAGLFDVYRVQALLAPSQSLSRLLSTWTMIFGALAVVLLMVKAGPAYSRIWLLNWYTGVLSVLIVSRAITARIMRRWNANGRFDRNAVLVGGGQPAAELILALEGSHNTDVSVVGIFDDREDARSPAVVQNLPKLGNVAELVEFVRRSRIDLLLVTLPLTAEERLLQILKRLWVLPVDIRLSAYSQKLHYRPRAYSYIGNVPFLDVFDKPLGEWGAILKAVEDKVIAALAVVVLAPVMALVALAVRLESKGPILFKQKRYGFNNELIEVFKFRSMYHEMSDADAARLVTKGDPRVTRVGRFIRKTSLDELPQFFNVLRGELSLVGPRPHATKAKAADQLYNDVVDGYFARHKVKPGITGWAQVNGWRGETDTTEKLQRRVDHDLYYIENWSLALDLYILWRTPFSLLNAESAY
jgi:Undecaprenyl-phosphate glucose phosphotransferase